MIFKKGDLIIKECSVKDGDRYRINCFLCVGEINQYGTQMFLLNSLTNKSINYCYDYEPRYVGSGFNIKKVLFDSRKLRNKK